MSQSGNQQLFGGRHTLSFIFSVTAIDTQLRLHEYETTITIQHDT